MNLKSKILQRSHKKRNIFFCVSSVSIYQTGLILAFSVSILIFGFTPGFAQQMDHSGGLLNEAYQYYQKEDYNNAIGILEDILSRDSMQVRAYELLASSQLKMDKPDDAANTIRRGLHYFPNQINLHWLKAESDFLLGNVEQAKKQYLKLEKQYGSSHSDQYLFNKKLLRLRLYQSNMLLFKHAAAAQKWDKARGFLRQASIYQPDSSGGVSRNLILTYIRQKKWPDAVTAVDSVLKRFPQKNELLRLKAIALYHEKKYAELLTIYHQLYDSDPSNLEYALPYAELLAANNNMTAADTLYRKLLKQYPGRREVYNSLLSMSRQNHSPIGELKVLQRMRKHFPDDPGVLEKMAAVYARLDSSQTERLYYDSLLTMTHDTLTYQMKKVQSYRRDGNDTAAYQILVPLSRRFSQSPDVWETKGRIEERMDDWHKALQSYKILKRLHNNAEIEKQLGTIFEKLQKPDSAIIHYHRAMNRATSDPYVPYRLAELTAVKDSVKSFDLARFALHIAFRRLQEEQSKFRAQMQQKQTITGLARESDQADRLKHINSIAKEDFAFLTQNFPENKIQPLLDDLLDTYRGSGRLYTMVAQYYLIHNYDRKALGLLQQSARWNPDLVKTQRLLGNYYDQHNQTAKAIQAYSKVITLDESDGAAYGKLIDLYQMENRLDQLCDQWMLQFRTHRKNRILQQRLIEALDKAGRYQEARQVSKEGRKLGM